MKTQSSQSLAAKEIKQYMKANGIIGRVKSDSFAGGNSVVASVTDLTPDAYKKLCEFSKKYQYGSFNSMEDLYEFSNSRNDIPQAKYVTVNNEISDGLRQQIWDYILRTYNGMEGAPALADDARSFFHSGFDVYGSNLIHRLFSGGYNNEQFWNKLSNATKESEAEK